MNKYIVCLFLFSAVIACQNKNKETNTSSDEDVVVDTSTTQSKIDCDSIWKTMPKSYAQREGLIQQLISRSEGGMPEENLKLLNALLDSNDSVLQFKQPLSAVFKDLEAEPFIISNAIWREVSESYTDYYPEGYLLKKVDTIKSDTMYFKSRLYFKNILNEFSKEERLIKVIGLQKTRPARVTVLGMQHSECEPYAFYNFKYLNDDALSTPLVASPYQLEIEHGSWPKIDALIEQHPVYQCYDCLHSYDKAKTFARLSGTTNVFFAFHGPEKAAKDSYTPSRSLMYVTEEDKIITLWSDAIDLFGCSCL